MFSCKSDRIKEAPLKSHSLRSERGCGLFWLIAAQFIECDVQCIRKLDRRIDGTGVTAHCFFHCSLRQAGSIRELLNGHASFITIFLDIHSNPTFQNQADERGKKCNQSDQLKRFDNQTKDFLFHLDS